MSRKAVMSHLDREEASVVGEGAPRSSHRLARVQVDILGFEGQLAAVEARLGQLLVSKLDMLFLVSIEESWRCRSQVLNFAVLVFDTCTNTHKHGREKSRREQKVSGIETATSRSLWGS